MKMLKLLNSNQKGFTMIEVILAIAVTAIITGGITMSIFQVFNLNARTSNHMAAVNEVQSAGYWISHDTQMAQIVAPDPGATGFPLTLTWTEYGVDGDDYQVDYTLEDMASSTLKNLQRIHSINGVATETAFVAQYINPDPTKTKCELIDTNGDGVDDKLILTITATVGTGSQVQSETRIYEVTPRPSV